MSAEGGGSYGTPTFNLSNAVQTNLKRTFDMFVAHATLPIPEYEPSQKFKIAVKINSEYTTKRAPEAQPLVAPAGPPGPAGLLKEKGESEVTRIIKKVEEEKREAEQRRAGHRALITYVPDGPGRPGEAAAAGGKVGGGTQLAVRRQPTKLPTPEWHAPWKLQSVISGHLGWVRAIAFDPSNEWFVTGSADRTIKVWDLAKCSAGAEGGLRLTLTGHINCIRGLAVSPRSPFLFSAAEDKKVMCWDLETNKVVRHYHGHLSGVYCLQLHPTLDLLVTGGRDSVARVWDMRSKQQVHVLGGHTNAVGAIATNAIDPQIITASHDCTIKLWDLIAGKSMTTLTHHKKAVRDLKMSPTEFSFVSAGADNMKKWQARDGVFLNNISGHNGIVNSLAINEDGVLFSGGDNGSMVFWDYNSGYPFQRMETVVQPGSLDSEAGIFASTFDLSGTRLITCEADKTIKIWKEDPQATESTHPIDLKSWQKDFAARRAR